MSTSFPLGKLPADVLARLLAKVRPVDPRVLVGPGIGLDADDGRQHLYPDSHGLRRYTPQGCPGDRRKPGGRAHRNHLHPLRVSWGRAGSPYRRRRDAGPGDAGAPGHAEGTSGARPGDALVLTKGMAREQDLRGFTQRLHGLDDTCTPEGVRCKCRFLERCRSFLTEPGISIVRDAALPAGDCHICRARSRDARSHRGRSGHRVVPRIPLRGV